jgi:hypothetical protein
LAIGIAFVLATFSALALMVSPIFWLKNGFQPKITTDTWLGLDCVAWHLVFSCFATNIM